MILDDLTHALHPVGQVIDDWSTNRKLALVFEAKMGAGKLLVCSIDLKSDLEQNPVARQMRYSLLRYMGSDQFKPAVAFTVDQVRGLMTELPTMMKLGARVVRVDSYENGNEAENAVDGDPTTMWHTAWRSEAPDFPHEIVIEFAHPVNIPGFTALPRQDWNRNGWIKEYEFYVSMDGENWDKPVTHNTFSDDAKLKTVLWDSPVQGRFIRLVAISGYANGPWASLAEVEVVE